MGYDQHTPQAPMFSLQYAGDLACDAPTIQPQVVFRSRRGGEAPNMLSIAQLENAMSIGKPTHRQASPILYDDCLELARPYSKPASTRQLNMHLIRCAMVICRIQYNIALQSQFITIIGSFIGAVLKYRVVHI